MAEAVQKRPVIRFKSKPRRQAELEEELEKLRRETEHLRQNDPSAERLIVTLREYIEDEKWKIIRAQTSIATYEAAVDHLSKTIKAKKRKS